MKKWCFRLMSSLIYLHICEKFSIFVYGENTVAITTKHYHNQLNQLNSEYYEYQ
jgi:hypothetical protein|nr:MAG TPA: hypothetical protein [Caudoviricetes sp.]